MKQKLFVALIGIVFLVSGCKKTDALPENNTLQTGKENPSSGREFTHNGTTYTVPDGILTFETFDDYESIVNAEDRQVLTDFARSVESANLFENYYSVVSEREKDQFDFLGKLLNNEGFIRINSWLILTDFSGSTVYAALNGTTDHLLAAKSGRPVDGVLKFAIQDDVIEELKLAAGRGLFCNASWQNSFENFPANGSLPTNLYSLQNVGGGSTMWMQEFIHTSVKYWPAGIYFELNSRVVVTPAGNPLATAPFSYTTSYSCKRRCGNSFSGTSTRSFINASNDKNVMYWNTRALTQGYTTITSVVTSSASIPAGASRTATY